MSHSMDGYDDPYGTDDPWAETVPRKAQTPVSAPAHGDGWGVVQVRIAGAGKRTYAYAADHAYPVGTWVELPGNVVSEDGGTGVVASYGRDGYDGPLKTIVRDIPEPSPFMIRMAVVKTMDGAAKIYDDAVAAGVSGDELAAVVLAGQRRLAQRGVR